MAAGPLVRTSTGGRIRIGTITVAALTTATLLLAGCSSTSSNGTSTTSAGSTASAAASGPVNVVASTNVWGDITKQIGGEHVNVTSILSDPNADPHQYEADAKTGAAISKAQLVVENGLGYDDFMDKLLAASPNANRTVLNAADVMKISGSDANPHIWYDIAKIPDVASAIADQLGKLDPADAGDIHRQREDVHRQPDAYQRPESPTSRPSIRAHPSATPNGCRVISSRRQV